MVSKYKQIFTYDLERLADFECPLELLLPERERERDLE